MSKTATLKYMFPPQVVRDFAGVRGRVRNAVENSPRSVCLADARLQISRFMGKAQSELPKRK